MKKLIIILLLNQTLLFSSNINNFKDVEKIWNVNSFNDGFEYYFSSSNEKLSNLAEYQKVSEHIDEIFNKNTKIIRVISAKQHHILLNKERPEYKYDPDFCFVYLNEKSDVRIVYYCKDRACVIDTIVDIKQNIFNNLSNMRIYKRLNEITQYQNNCTNPNCWKFGMGISLSIYTPKDIFAVSYDDFWEFNNKKIVLLKGIVENDKTLKHLELLIKSIAPIADFRDRKGLKINISE